MDSNPQLIGVLMYLVGGAFGASFYLPFKKVKGWAWECAWLIYAVTALVLVPWVLAVVFSPNVFSVLKSTPTETLGKCLLFGAMWGVGGLTWGLGIRYLGVGLGLAIACGSCAAFGTLVPPIADGTFHQLLDTSKGYAGIATLAGVGISLVGIILTGAAGMSKSSELSEEQKKATVAEFSLAKGLFVALFSGIMSAGMSFGLRAGDAIKDLARTTEPKTPDFWLGLPALVVILFGGFAVNSLWCLFLNLKNGTGGDYVKAGIRIVPNLILSALAGGIWYGQMLFYQNGDTRIGEWAYSGWSLIMSSQIIFSTLLGIALGEWKGVSSRTKTLMLAGLLVLVASLAVIGYGNYLKT